MLLFQIFIRNIVLHPELITFLSAHANGELKKHTDLLLNHHHDIVALIVNKFTHK